MTYDTTTSPLLRPARLGDHELANRLVMAPMTRNRAESDGTATPLMAEYYAQRAAAGLIIAEASTPNPVVRPTRTSPPCTPMPTPPGGAGSPMPSGPRAAGPCSFRSSTADASDTRTPAA